MVKVKCCKCGQVNSGNNKFCDSCGEELRYEHKKQKGVIRYIIGTIIIFLGFSACLNSNYFTGVTLMFCGISLFPVIYDTILNSVKIKYLYVFLPLVFFGMFLVLNPIDDRIKDSIRDKEKMSQYKEFSWPSSDIAQLIPVPKSNIGKINWEKSDGFSIEVSETSFKDYKDYVLSCQKKGFEVNYKKGDNYYYSNNESGYRISLNYDDEYKVMEIRLNEEKTSNSSNEADMPNEESSGIKELLDSYELVINEYVDFMNKYKTSNYSVSMMSDYLKILDKYTEFVEKIDKLNVDELNEADMKYYLDVTLRVTEKLKELS